MIQGDIAVNRTYKFVGECIYCGSIENLHDEHCIPESLNGVRILEKGSCGDCGKITSKFEGSYARESMLPVRTAWNMKSKRSKRKRPTEFPMRFEKDGQIKIINVPIEDHYSVVPMLEIGPPGKYPDIPHPLGLKTDECQLHAFNIRPDEHINHLVEKYGADKMSVDFQIHVSGFLRMIAKIAYCTAVWRYGLSSIGEKYVVPAILGSSTNISHWVGSDGTQTVHDLTKYMKTDHVVNLYHEFDGELRAHVKLFKNSHTPEYQVIVGRLTEQAHGLYQCLGH